MKNIKNIHNITLEQAMEIMKTYGITFIIRDGKLKGFSKVRLEEVNEMLKAI